MPWELIVQSSETDRTEYRVRPGKTTLGRMSSHDIVIQDEAASRNHAVVELDSSDRLIIWDAGSTNGTFVNGRQIYRAQTLDHNDQVRIGLHLITVVSTDAGRATGKLTGRLQPPRNYENLLMLSLDHYTVLLHDLSMQLSKIQNLDELQNRIAAFVGRMINSDECGIVMAEDFGDLMHEFGSTELVDHVVQTKEPLLISIHSGDAAIRPDIASLVLCPVLIDQETVALIYAIKHDKEARAFEELDRLLVVGVSHHAAMTIQRLKYEQALLHSANFDMLTGLPNRKLFLERLSRAIARAKRHPTYGFAVFFIDANNFKLINDSLGHQLGDQVLREIGVRLQKNFRELDTVARFGGDEFAVLVDDVHGIQEVLLLAQRLLDSTSEPYIMSGHEFVLSLSAGITLSSMGYDFAEDAMRDADIAMYKSKEGSEATFRIYDQVMHAQLMQSLKLQTDLRNAYKLQEFMLQYQPIIALDTGEIRGFEALLRWNSHGQGIIMPDQFLSSIDTTGLLNSLERWVLRKACDQIVLWNQQFDRPIPLFMSVNLTNKQLANPNLLELIKNTLSEYSLDSDRLWLEISEKNSINDEEVVIPKLRDIRSLGVHLCLDDFGTGYSTLGYLSRLPISVLKIDRSFINGVELNAESNKIVHTVIGLADNLGLNLVAEGVETQGQLNFLKQSRCHYAQGYYFSEPLDADQVTLLLQSNHSYSKLIPAAGATHPLDKLSD